MKFKEYKKKAEKDDYLTFNKSNDEIEDYFWKNIAFSPPLYGSDVKNTLFDKGVKWNLSEIKSLLTYGLKNNL